MQRHRPRAFVRLLAFLAIAPLALLPYGHIPTALATAGTIKEFPLPAPNSLPSAITTGPDGALWFTEAGKIGRSTTAGALTEFPMPGGRTAASIARGPDGALWLTEPKSGLLGRVTTTGSFSEFAPPGNPPPGASYSTPTIEQPQVITAGPDGALWYTETIFSRTCGCVTGGKIGRISTSGSISEFTLPTGTTRRTASQPAGITAGPDGALWFTDTNLGKIGRMTTSGSLSQFPVPGAPQGITAGPDGALWFTANASPAGRVGRITTGGVVSGFSVPAGPNGNTVGASIATGADGNLWFASYDLTTSSGAIQRLTTSGTLTAFPFSAFDEIDGLTAGPNTAIWFTTSNNQSGASHIGEISTS